MPPPWRHKGPTRHYFLGAVRNLSKLQSSTDSNRLTHILDLVAVSKLIEDVAAMEIEESYSRGKGKLEAEAKINVGMHQREEINQTGKGRKTRERQNRLSLMMSAFPITPTIL
jgi:hypothetical protein